MTQRRMIVVDGNQAVASVAYRLTEVIAIYPITPSSTMGERADVWADQGRTNIWGTVPDIVEMQSEGGAIGAVHGALQSGSLSTTFTASQGLLLMIPSLYKIAGELTPICMHVSSRTVATHALSIFGDHSDVMACRQTGVALLASGSVQEVQDLAMIGHAATLRARLPFLHFFDGFRTSHEIAKIEELTDDDLQAMIDDDLVAAHRARALSPDHPVLRGSSQNPDTFFQMQEARAPYYAACPNIVQEAMDQFAALTGRAYHLFDYVGDPDAERVIVIMGSGAETVHQMVEDMNRQGEKVGVLKVRLFRPFAADAFIQALPKSVKTIAVMDRTREHGAIGEPLFLDVVAALRTGPAPEPKIIGGCYGLSSKEFTPAMVRAIYDELAKTDPNPRFSIGINDDVRHLSLTFDPAYDREPEEVKRAVFFGLGSDGTVGANKNSIKIIAESTSDHVQGYFVFDSKKTGAITTSHLRFSPNPIRSSHLITQADFLACHQFGILDKVDVLKYAAPGGTLLLSAPYDRDEVWSQLSRDDQQSIIDKKLKLFVIDGQKVAAEAGMGNRINTVMQTCFFAISGVLELDDALARIKASIEETYHGKGHDLVARNLAAVENAIANLYQVTVPKRASATTDRSSAVSEAAPEFVKKVTAAMMSDKGNSLPVSVFPVDGTWPLSTSKWEKRNLADDIPVWIPELCIQCNKCTLVCPHAAIRVKVCQPEELDDAPPDFQSMDYTGKEFGTAKYVLQVAPEDCTGCMLCIHVCPGVDKKHPDRLSLFMAPQPERLITERAKWQFFSDLPDAAHDDLKPTVKLTQFSEPLMEFSGACSGCGETPYIKMITQLFGDRMVIANATGCSSIYGGNLPTTPYTVNHEGRGPAWANSLFEDNAEFGFGMRLGIDKHYQQARDLLVQLAAKLDAGLVEDLLACDQKTETDFSAQRLRVVELRRRLAGMDSKIARRLEVLADYLVKKTVWIVGGDGWAYDIGYGGLDHVLASGRDVNVLVLDTEAYSNTGGQQSKATSMGAAAKFAVAGKERPKKDLGLIAMTYGNIYVASVAFGARDAQTVKAFVEAASYDGPSLILAYSSCIEHGFDLENGLEHMKLAVESGYWPLYRYDPRRRDSGLNPLQIDAIPSPDLLAEFTHNENRFGVVERHDPVRYRQLLRAAEENMKWRQSMFDVLAGRESSPDHGSEEARNES